MDFNFNMGTNNRINAASGENTALRKEGGRISTTSKIVFYITYITDIKVTQNPDVFCIFGKKEKINSNEYRI